jgi:hypothetical protein
MHGGCQSESEADGMVEPWMRRSTRLLNDGAD